MPTNNLSLVRQRSGAYIRAAEGSGTTTLSDRDQRWQVFNLSAARTVVLPTTDIAAGDVWRIENIAAFDLTVQSSNGSALTIAGGANIDATIQKGYVILCATQAAPTTPAHWYVVEVYEKSVFNANFNQGAGSGGSGTTKSITAFRHNNVVTLSSAYLAITTGGSAASSYGTASGEIPTRFRPVNEPMFFTNKYVGGAGQTDSGPTSITISSAGAITIYRVFQRNSNWPASTGDTGADYLEATYKNN